MPAHTSAHRQPIRLLAPAKLTLQLRITDTRRDGHHLIDAEMVTLDLCDELVVHPSTASSVEVVPSVGAAGAADWDIPSDRSNLVIRALELAGRTAHVEIRKRIPPGAGLGGGSADAGAVLRWTNRLAVSEAVEAASKTSRPQTPTLVSPQQAATLGADVAFCLTGGRARVTGIGEILESIPFRHQAFVLWTPPIQVNTAAVYRMWDEMGGPGGGSNDLEPAALAVCPQLAAWRDELAQATGRTPQLAGSGGTWFVAAPFGTRLNLPVRDGISALRARVIGRL
ncbi:4-(cytidine 5'-diphospho)-2-C-methyl-D-erythritol kinase [Candidatus Poriferisodalis sp.]|uniref:4-(cytidine 5'-diphospho)-2-C-methyl-D-erythritol kinase n=1 Tax=Candidatus Poriferisodalis sp. TaxID=3101277 RepID=UPI003B5AD59E